uniref:Carboxylic ester hydrolase n=1 Tax=Parastrongyloides trichosuri TaxID=131310 RepID=A0A0N4ZWJ2_PARTI
MNQKCLILFVILFILCKEISLEKKTEKARKKEKKSNKVKVSTTFFNVEGKRFPLTNLEKNITEFLGIPYAFPQTKVGRFMPPQPLNASFTESLNKTYQAFTLANTCPQFIYKTNFEGNDFLLPTNNISEDCLQLNMWVPDKDPKATKNMSTIIYIYGGSFATGSASLDVYNGSILAASQNVIVITLNYRVGPLGFAYFGEDTNVKGNMGLLDQQVGLKWIYDNIKFFGGDKDNITLFGQSAGAASVTAHLLSNKSHPYFDKMIANSGAITNVWATVPSYVALNNTLWLSSIMNCTNATDFSKLTNRNKTDIIKCMQKANTTLLNDNQFTTRDKEQPPLPYTFLPVYNDTVFFNGSLFERLKEGKIKTNVTKMFGRVSEEGSYFLPFLLGEKYGCGFNHTLGAKASTNQCKGIPGYAIAFIWTQLGTFLKADIMGQLLLSITYNNEFVTTNQEKAIEIFGDFMFNCDSAQFAEINDMVCEKDSYFFEFRKRSTVTPWPQWMGVMHGYELEYVFGRPFRYPENYEEKVLEKEKEYSLKIMSFYGSFAKKGTPNYNWLPFKDISASKCQFHNQYGAVIDDTFDASKYPLKYTDVITEKCSKFNLVANKHEPRFEPQKRLYNRMQYRITQSLDRGTFDLDFPMLK